MNEDNGFFASLMDFSFKEFITTRIVKFLYFIAILFAALVSLGLIVRGFSLSMVRGILFLIISPLIFIVYVILARVWLEIVIVIFRIAENTSLMVKNNQKET
ncbi:MAG: hypothetical protein A2161_09890 [Candidatus Schekmanbacteria bacterium RBG_13_48_7]|uniref:DUF4282 domain-containing protein n=1 Tax=Candidatus Schekmanbacteria bacterium RBG_13_48_7 TaxID=1817878 RepID=A0A1F7RSE2_9BACT|nr:MAG: hypothetical protein A2161_09890 [Candidatus Schekmanbacteria bacterium RBG_13_48_7]